MKTKSKRFSLITLLAVIIIACATVFGITLRSENVQADTTAPTAATGQVFVDNGTNTTVTEPYVLTEQILTSPKTIEIVVRLNSSAVNSSGGNRYGTVLGGYSGGGNKHFNIEFTATGRVRVFWYNNSASNGLDYYSNTELVTEGRTEEWLHIVFVRSGSQPCFYINGVKDQGYYGGNSTLSTGIGSDWTIDASTETVPTYWVGADNRTNNLNICRFNGAIKFIGLSSTAKTADQISTAYNNSQTWGDLDDYEFRDTVVEDGGMDTTLYKRLPSKVNPYATYGYTGPDFSDGTASYQIGTLSAVPHTFEALVKFDGTKSKSGRVGAIIGSYGSVSGSSNNFNIEISAENKPRFYWRRGNVDWYPNVVLPTNEWIHLVFIRVGSGDAGKIECYVNGVLVDVHDNSSGDSTSSQGAGDESSVADAPWIGRDYRDISNSGSTCFHGQINYVGASSATMTAADVKNAYLSATRLVKAADSTTIISEQPMRAVYKAEEIITSTINTVTATVNVPTYNVQRGVIFGTYGIVGPHRFNVEITAGNKIRVFYQTEHSGATFDENIAGDYASILASGEDRHIVVTRMKRSGDWVAGNTGTGNYTKFAMWIYDTAGTLLGGPYYTNNSSEAETKYAETDIVSKLLPTIGGDNRSQSVQYPFPGKIKMVAVYSNTMTATEAASSASYASSGTDITVDSTFGKTYGVLGHWELTDAQDDLIYNATTATGANATLEDVSNNGNPMTIKSVAQYIEIGNSLIGTENNDADWFVAGEDEYTFIYVPDTQVTVHWHSDSITAMQNWITTNADAMNLAIVMGLGDIQDGGPEVSAEATGDGDYCLNKVEQWEAMQNFYKALDDNGILWSAIMGNHDYDSNSPTAENGRRANLYNTYFGWSAISNIMTNNTSANAIIARYSDGYIKDENEVIKSEENQNVIYEFTAGGVDYLLVAFEFGPSDSMLEWASSIISRPEYANHRVLVNTHSLVYATGEFNNSLTTDNPEAYGWKDTYGININNGSQMWDEFLSKHDNIFMATSGHIIYDEVMRRYDVGDNGNTVLSMLIDAQGTAYYNQSAYGVSGDGVIMVAKVNETNKTVTFRYFNPEANAFFMVENQFTYDFSNNIGLTKQVVIENEDLTTDLSSAASGTTVTVTLDNGIAGAPKYSYWVPAVKTASGTAVSYSNKTDTSFTFVMPAERVYVDIEGIKINSSITLKIDEVKDLASGIPEGYTVGKSGTSAAVNLNGTKITGIDSGTATLLIKNASGATCLTVTVTVTKDVLVAPSVVDQYLNSDEFKSYEVGARLRLMWTEYNSGVTFVGQMPTVLAKAVQPKLLIVPQYYLDGIRSSTNNANYAEATKYLEAGDYLTGLEISGLPYSIVETPYQIESGDTTLLLGGIKAIQDTNMNRAWFGIYFYEYYGTTYYAKLPEGLEQNVSRSMAWVVSGMVNEYTTYEDSSTYSGTTLDEHAEELTKNFLDRAIKDALTKQGKKDGVNYLSQFDANSISFTGTNRKTQLVSFNNDGNDNYILSATYFDTLPTYQISINGYATNGTSLEVKVGSNLDFKPNIQVVSGNEKYVEFDEFGNVNVKGVTNGMITDAIKVGFAYQNKDNYELETYAFDLAENTDYVDLGVPDQYYEDADNQPSSYKPMANVEIKPDGVKRLKSVYYEVIPEYGTQNSTSGTISVTGSHLVGDTTVVTGTATQTFKIDSVQNRTYTLTVQHKTKAGATLAEDSKVLVSATTNYIYNETAQTTTDNKTAGTTAGATLESVISAIAGGKNKLSQNYLPDYFWLEGQLEGDTTVTVTYSAYDTWDGTVASGYARGAGTKSDPYIIETAEQLAYMARVSFDNDYGSGMYFELAKSLNLNNISWTPICFDTSTSYTWNWFKGEFNGNGYTIANLKLDGNYINASGTAGTKDYGYGLFSAIGDGGVVKNLTINGTANVGHRVGSAAYYLGTNAKVSNIKNFASLTTTRGNIGSVWTGGIVGTVNNNNSIIENCVNYGTISASGGTVGGISGQVSGAGADIINSINYGDVFGGYAVGGIVGLATQNVHDCKNYGDINVTTAVSSIFVSQENVQVKNVSTGYNVDMTVSFERYGTQIGGIVGSSSGGVVVNSENWGKVTGATSTEHNTNLDTSTYVLVTQQTNMGVGGIIGFNNRGGVENSVNHSTVTGCSCHTNGSIGHSVYYLSEEGNEQVMLIFRFVSENGNTLSYHNLAVKNGIYYDGRNRGDENCSIALYTTTKTVTNGDGTSYEQSVNVRGSLEEKIAYEIEKLNYNLGAHYEPSMYWWSGFINGDTVVEIKISQADVWDGSVATSFAGGTGTEADPYLISTGAQLAYLSKLSYGVNYGNGKYFKLINSIDLNGHEWIPIGWDDDARYNNQESTYSFRGHFDGNGYSIAGLKVSNLYGNSAGAGLFGYFRAGSLKDLVVQGNVIGSQRVGGVAYRFYNCTVDNVKSFVDVTATGEGEGKYVDNAYTRTEKNSETGARWRYRYAGSFAAQITTTSVITNCASYGTVTVSDGIERTGAAIGILSSSTLINFDNYGTLNAESPYAGGVIGNSSYAIVFNSTNYGDVNCTTYHVGGIVGEMTNFTTVYGCINYGDITGTDQVGGCFGYIGGGSSYAECENEGTVTGTTEKVGEIVGWDNGSTLSNQYVDKDGDSAYDAGEEYYVIVINYFYEDGSIAADTKKVFVYEGYFGQDTVGLTATGATSTSLVSPTIDGYLPDKFWVSGYADRDQIFNVTYSKADAWDGTSASSFAGGNGTKYNPYLIETAEQLAMLSTMYKGVTYDYASNTYYKLVNSIDLTGYAWTPIGTRDASTWRYFEGYFDGNGKTIAGMTVTNGFAAGLFQAVAGRVENLTIEGNISVTTRAGAVCYYLGSETRKGYVDNVKAFVDITATTVTTSGSYVGGIFGTSRYAVATNCENYGDISGAGTDVGGVAGQIYYSGYAENCVNYGAVTATGTTANSNLFYGGILGRISASNLYNSKNYGPIGNSAINNDVGGIVGQIINNSRVQGCINQGTVSGVDIVAGISSYLGAGSEIIDCENKASATITASDSAAGIVGNLNGGYVEGCINRAKITGLTMVGGIASDGYTGSHTSNSIIVECENYGAIVGNTMVGGIIGNTSSIDVIRCSNAGAVSATLNTTLTGTTAAIAGGIAGYCTNATVIEDCTNTGNVTGTHDNGTNVGGIAGYLGDLVTSTYRRVGYCSQIINGTNSGTVKEGSSTYTSGIDSIVGYNSGWVYTLKDGVITNVSDAKGTEGRPELYNKSLEVYADGVADETFWSEATTYLAKTTYNSGTATEYSVEIKGARVDEGIKGIAFLVTVTHTHDPDTVLQSDGSSWHHYPNVEIRFNDTPNSNLYKCYINSQGALNSRFTNEGMNGGFTTTLSNGVYTSVYEWFVPYTAVVDYDTTAASGTWGVSETEEITFRIGGCIENVWDAWWVGTSSDYSNAGKI